MLECSRPTSYSWPSDRGRGSDVRQPLTLVAADALEADAAVAGSRHVVTRGVVHALAQLLAAVAERPRRALWSGEGTPHVHLQPHRSAL